MEKQFDAQAVAGRAVQVAKQIRKSEAYPAIVGGIAGGIAGALMAVVIAGRRSAPQPSPAHEEGAKSQVGWTVREALQLLTIVASIAKQAQEWYKGRAK